MISLIDINDNPPRFQEDYHPVVMENLPAGQKVVEVLAADEDTISNGPPFEFWVACHGACPCHENPSCRDFEFKYMPGEVHGFIVKCHIEKHK